jgi:putative restriction endonuclease
MKSGQRLWNRDELILAFNLYCKLPFGRMHSRNPEIIELAGLIDRTPSAVALKLVNFASLDPELQARGITGQQNVSKLDREIWNEFNIAWDQAYLESERLLAEKQAKVQEGQPIRYEDQYVEELGEDREGSTKDRKNQWKFRVMVLSNYDSACCITGINAPELLIASHIVPWSKDKSNRLNPMNGLCLNALHDKAFDCGMITVDSDNYTIRVTSRLKGITNASIDYNFAAIDGMPIQLPKKFLPSPDFLRQHNDTFKP